MQPARLFVLASTVVLGLFSLEACGSDKNVPTASCSTSTAAPSEADCKAFGEKSGCNVSRVSGTGCAFEECDSPPSCDVQTPQPNPAVDAGRDPKCDRAEANGLFGEVPPCADYTTVTVNGAPRYACKCGSCACGYKCGSIALAQGGVISNVCAP